MIKVIIKCPVQTDKIDAFIALAGQLAALARSEPGCAGYQIAQDKRASTIVFLDEAWESDEQLAAHMGKAYFKELSDQMVSLQDGPADIRLCSIVG